MMDGSQVKLVRASLSKATGKHVSVMDLGLALGLQRKRAERSVREWEHDQPTGPAAVALTYLAASMKAHIPEHVAGVCEDDARYVVRLRWPRFLMSIEDDDPLPAVTWLDDPSAFASELRPIDYIERAREFGKEHFG